MRELRTGERTDEYSTADFKMRQMCIRDRRSLAPPGVKLIEWGHKLGFCYISDYANHTDEVSALARHIAVSYTHLR